MEVELLQFLEPQFLSDFRDIFFSQYSLRISMFNWWTQSLPILSAFSALVCSSVSKSLQHDFISRTQQRSKLNVAERKFDFSGEEAPLKMQW